MTIDLHKLSAFCDVVILSAFAVFGEVSCVKKPDPEPVTPPTSTKVLIENFEGTSYRMWKIEGDAFSWSLPGSESLTSWGCKGYEGQHIITSCINGDQGIGTFTSPNFDIQKDYINFLVSGGGDYKNEYVALFVDGEEVFRESGSNSRVMAQIVWNVSQYKGRTAYIRIIDDSAKAWGFIEADYFYQSDSPAVSEKSREITLTSKYLNFPISPSANMGTVRIYCGGDIVYDVDLRLTDGTPSYWVHMNCAEWKGKTLKIVIPYNQFLNVQQPIAAGNALTSISQSDVPYESASFYSEPLRPLAHFTSIRGWLNDPCGLIYCGGVWHMSYQHNPFGTDWGNMHWGHAVSQDLVHWKEYDDVLRPDSLGVIFSGYALEDKDNVLGLKKSSFNTLVAYYTAAGEYNYASRNEPFTTCMAYSVDGGYTWQKYSHNPILKEVEFHNRDPHVVWSPEDGKWVMVLYLENNSYGFFESSDLIDWKETNRFYFEGEWECPDFFRIKIEETGGYKWVLLGVQNKYYVGTFSNGVFTPETAQKKQDLGTSYLAAHTFSNAPNGRHVQIGCMGDSKFPSLPFDEMMAFPKELTLHKDKDSYSLFSLPVEEISHLYKTVLKNIADSIISPDCSELTYSGAAFHIKAIFDLNASTSDHFGFIVNDIQVLYYPGSHYFCVKGGSLSTTYFANDVISTDGKMSMEIIVDNGIIESFINDGQYCATLYHLTSDPTMTVSAVVSGGNVKADNVIIAELNHYWN